MSEQWSTLNWGKKYLVNFYARKTQLIPFHYTLLVKLALRSLYTGQSCANDVKTERSVPDENISLLVTSQL